MAHYIDGFVLPVPKRKLAAYLRMARQAAKIFRELGALDYRECVGDDLNVKFGRPFPRGVKSTPAETVVFSWVVYKSRAHRDRVNKKIMHDPRIQNLCDPKNLLFNPSRMLYGGFKVMVE